MGDRYPDDAVAAYKEDCKFLDFAYDLPSTRSTRRGGSSYCAGSCTVECGCAMSNQKFTIEIEQEQDQRWIAEVVELPGVMTYGNSPDDAMARVQALALRVLADRLEHGESVPEFLHISFEAA